MSDIVYVYGFVETTSASPPRALSGVNGAPVSLVSGNDISAVVSYVPDNEFSPAVIDANIQDLNWVGARGMEHERIVAWFVDHSDILPVSLFTLYSGEEALARDMAQRSGDLRRVMQRLHNHREWDIKISYDETQLAKHAADVVDSIRALDTEIGAAAPGRKFLLEKKRKDMLAKELAAAARARARAMFDALATHATDAVTLPMPRNEGLPVVLNAALLVAKENEAAMRAAAEEQARRMEPVGIHANLTGPWAPYRFMEAQDEPAV